MGTHVNEDATIARSLGK